MAQSLDVLRRFDITDRHSGLAFGGKFHDASGDEIEVLNPATGERLGTVIGCTSHDYDRGAEASETVFRTWRMLPPPARGEIVRQIGMALREHKNDLGLLVTLEAGKITSEGRGEVQEMIDMCDFAVGLSRQLHGLTIATERPEHRLFEQWLPLGPVGVITAFNFPVAVWAWNAALAAVCGDTVLWKPSHLTPLTAIATQKIVDRVLNENDVPGVFQLVVGDRDVGERLAADVRFPLISATGSCAMGREVGTTVAKRLGRSLLELGGNNAVILTPSANLDLALRAVLFAALGTAGQRCTTLRRLIVHESIADSFVAKLAQAYRSVKIGLPWEEGTLIGPLIRESAVAGFLKGVAAAQQQGGKLICGGKRIDRPGFYVEPTIIRATSSIPIVAEETFAPLLYILTYQALDEAIAIQNSVPQGLSSAIFTDRLQDAEKFLSPAGSDCGIANVNIGTSGAEIGGAFGGEKSTGGGREAGSDAWKAYMRRQTCTINYGSSLPLAQGVKFEV